ncbi:hypothetical protein AAG906_001593 [Vitis piasezkii]
MGQGYEDHLVTQEADIPKVERVQWRKIDAQLCSVLWQSVDPKILLHLRAYKTCFKFWTQAKGLYTNDIQRLYKQIASLKEEFLIVMSLTPDVGAQQTQLDKFFMVLTLIGLRPDLEPVRDQILGSSSVPSLDDVFARLLRISSTQTLPSDSISDSSVLVSHTTSRGGRSGNRGRGQRPHCTYCNKLGHTRDRCYQLHGRPPRTAHVAQSSDSQLPQPPSSSASQASQASVASVAQPGNASACLTHTSSLGPWILDSGASDHISGNKDLFSSITTTSALPTVTLANGSQTVAKGIGLTLPLPSLPLTSVLYTPECPFNLISISKITRTLNCSITFSDKFTIDIGRESQGLYHLTSDSSPAVCISTDAPLLIHSRLGHPSLSKFQKMVPRFSTLSSLSCESCQLGKHTRVSFPKRLNNRAKSPFELVHTDVWGPCRTAFTLGFQYFVTFIDDYSRSPFTSFMSHHGILHQSSCAHTPQQNGVAERKNRHLVETTRTILLHSNIPHFLLFPDQPLYFLPPRVFGCTCFVHILTLGQDKLSAKAMKCLFLGYSDLKGYRCYSLRLIDTLSSLILALPIVSPFNVVPPRLLQVYHRRLAPADSLPIPSASLACYVFSDDLPIAIRKGTHSTRNPHPIYNFLSYHRLSSPYSAFVDRLKARLVAKGYTQVYGSIMVTHSPLPRLLLGSLYGATSGFVARRVSLVCTLRRSLYGLKQSPRAWFDRFSSFVQEFGMLCDETIQFSIIITPWGGVFISVVYVGDIVITFGVVLSQRKYALDILEESGMLDQKPIETPMDLNVKLVLGQGDAVIRILRYIKSTPGQGVLYENKGHTQVVGYTDADWAGSPTDRQLRFGKDEQMKLICDNQPHYILHPIQVFHE